jgi:hypothetical protein
VGRGRKVRIWMGRWKIYKEEEDGEEASSQAAPTGMSACETRADLKVGPD